MINKASIRIHSKQAYLYNLLTKAACVFILFGTLVVGIVAATANSVLEGEPSSSFESNFILFLKY